MKKTYDHKNKSVAFINSATIERLQPKGWQLDATQIVRKAFMMPPSTIIAQRNDCHAYRRGAQNTAAHAALLPIYDRVLCGITLGPDEAKLYMTLMMKMGKDEKARNRATP